MTRVIIKLSSLERISYILYWSLITSTLDWLVCVVTVCMLTATIYLDITVLRITALS